MIWLDYSINQAGADFKITGDTETELIDKGLFKPGDVFVVDENGWCRKKDEIEILLIKNEISRLTRDK